LPNTWLTTFLDFAGFFFFFFFPATAADQGTRWRTADRCDGTLIAVTAGKVRVTDRVNHHTFILTAGHHYLVRSR
jgi:hypothetical protein